MEQIRNKHLLSALCPASETAIAVDNPATGEIIAYVPSFSAQQVEVLIAKSKQAQVSWQATSAEQRSDILYRWYELMLENQDDLARIMTLEQGKSLSEAMGEVKYGASFVKWFAEQARRTLGETIPSPAANKRLMTVKQAVGVTAAITPWNFPIAMITRKAAPALAAGCSMLVKPAAQTPISAYACQALALQAGLPEDLLTIVNHQDASVIGDIFCQHPEIKKLSFTGSTKVGRILMEQCASTVKRTSMELGGNAPFIVFNDADIDDAVQGAIASKFRNAGQTCVCANRFYVQRDVYDQFVDKFVAATSQLKVGQGLQADTDIGPLIDDRAKQSVMAHLERAVEQGARLALGGKELDGRFVEPSILTEVTADMDIVSSEIFGPVAPVIAFDDEDDLIAQANDTIYGLASYFYTASIPRAFKVAEALEYGMVGINEGLISTEVAPFGGVKQSGVGREGGQQGIDEYLNIKYLCFGGL